MGEKKKMPIWLIVVSAVVLVAVIVGAVIGVVALVSNNNDTTYTTPDTTPLLTSVPAEPVKPAALGSAWPTIVAFYTDLQHGDYAGAFALMTQADCEAFSSLADFQSARSGQTYDPANTTFVSESNDGQKSVLMTRNGRGDKWSVPCYNEGGSWHIAFSEAAQIIE